MLIFSTGLERALEMKFCHVTEIRDIVLTQMKPVPAGPNTPPAVPIVLSSSWPNPQTTSFPATGLQSEVSVGNGSNFDIEGLYEVKPLFLKVLRRVVKVNPTQVIFRYKEVNMDS